MRSLLFLWSSLVVATASGCAPTALTVDGGPTPDAGGPAGRLEIESEHSLALTVGEVAPVEVRYTEEDRPVAGKEVRFALEGTAHDATVADLARMTDVDGHVQTTVAAGTVASVFRVRVSADRAAPAYVNVSVGAEGFGALRVSAVYEGRRDPAVRRVVRVYSEIECDPPGGLPTAGDRLATIDDPEETEALFRTLPVGLHYTVHVAVEGADGTVLATGCADRVTLTRDEETPVTLELVDAPLLPAGPYDAELSVSATAAISGALERASAASTDRLSQGGARIYLDALEAELTERGETVTAEALAVERLSGDPDESLARELEATAEGPGEGLEGLLARLAARMALIRIGGPLALTGAGSSLVGAWSPGRIALGVEGDPDAPPPLELDALVAELTLAPVLSFAWRPDEDLLEVPSLTLGLPLARVLSAVLDAWTAEVDRPGELLVDGAGCDVVARWVDASPLIAPSCDATCARASCLRALEEILTPVSEALSNVSASRDSVRLEGSVVLTDDDGDLVVDRLEGRGLVGTYAGGPIAGSDPITADLLGARAVE